MFQYFIPPEPLAHRNHIIDVHRRLISEIRELEPRISALASVRDPRWRELEEERSALVGRIEPLIQEYWDWVPAVPLSRCPFCSKDLTRLFDPVDLRGFWWMDRTQRLRLEPGCCPHFCLLLGAVNVNGLAPRGGIFECRPGPDVPFVIPRILEFPTMQAVVSSVAMHCGYTAYPVAYFAKTPPPARSLSQSWARKEHRFSVDGRMGWDIIEETYDYDIPVWTGKGKLRWLHEGKISPPGADPASYPFRNVTGLARPQVLSGSELRYQSP